MEKIFQVSEFNELINQHLSLLPEVVVEGEISELKPWREFLYITIKDPSTSLSIFAIQHDISGWQSLEVGMKVHVFGVAKLSKKKSEFTLKANRILPAGEGALRLAFEKLKLQLDREGLFDPARKRPITKFPTRIGLITAPNSEAYNDFIKVARERMGGLTIFFYPVQVQGRNSVATLVSAFTYFNSHPDLALDCLVLCRGGGSLEDLISFNDEHVARAVFSSKVPVVVGVGHERDVSLCDFIADLRASTPSNAAELLFLHRRELLDQVNYSAKSLTYIMDNLLHHHRSLLSHLVSGLDHGVSIPVNNFKQLVSRLASAQYAYRSHLTSTVDNLTIALTRLSGQIATWHLHWLQSVDQLARLLETFNHQKILDRGYTLTRLDGQIVRSVRQATPGSLLHTQVSDGTINSHVSD